MSDFEKLIHIKEELEHMHFDDIRLIVVREAVLVAIAKLIEEFREVKESEEDSNERNS